jgi:hypothetical protein
VFAVSRSPTVSLDHSSALCHGLLLHVRSVFSGSHRYSLVLTGISQIGDILQTVAANPSSTAHSIPSLLRSPDIILKLILLSFLSLAPILGRDYLRGLISARSPVGVEDETDDLDKDERRFRWVSEWRTTIRLPSTSRSRSGSESHDDFEKFL